MTITVPHIHKSSIVSGNRAIQTYERDGLQIATEPIKEYVRLIGVDIDKTPRTVVIPETLRFLAAVGTVDSINRFQSTVKNANGETLYSLEIDQPYFTYNSLIVEKDSQIEISSNKVVSYFVIFAIQSQVIYDLTM